MRAQQAGHIINITSTMGLMSRPGVGFYSASKFAVEGLSEALWREVSPLGIRVTCVEPGAYATDGPGRSLRVRSRAIDAYAQTAGPVIDATAGSSGSAALPAPILAAQAIQAVFESSSPPTNLVLTRRGLDMLREKLAHLATTSDAWEAVSVAAGT